jgi:SAM-dependent methyltransferase
MSLTPNLESNLLHLGCGLTTPDNWLNVDGSLQVEFAKRPRLKQLLVNIGVYPRSQADIPWSPNVLRLNLRKQLPFEDRSFTAIYSSHTFEHLYHNEAVTLARECYRIMKPGGICRIVVPDLTVAIQRYLVNSSQPEITDAADRLMDELGLYSRSSKPGILGTYHNITSFHNHKWVYDAKSLKQLLIEAGFSEVSNPTGLQGKLPDLEKIESPSRVLDGAGIIAEGIKL